MKRYQHSIVTLNDRSETYRSVTLALQKIANECVNNNINIIDINISLNKRFSGIIDIIYNTDENI